MSTGNVTTSRETARLKPKGSLIPHFPSLSDASVILVLQTEVSYGNVDLRSNRSLLKRGSVRSLNRTSSRSLPRFHPPLLDLPSEASHSARPFPSSAPHYIGLVSRPPRAIAMSLNDLHGTDFLREVLQFCSFLLFLFFSALSHSSTLLLPESHTFHIRHFLLDLETLNSFHDHSSF